MHIEQSQFIRYLKNTYPNFFRNCFVLEIGSCNVNGSIRENFENCNYIGIDVGAGDCVDEVCSGHEYAAPNNSFDMVISTECFEHNPFWFETFQNMIRMCKPGGMVAFTCAGEIRPEHGTSRVDPASSPLTQAIGWGDYYRNLSSEDFKSKMNFDDVFFENNYVFIDSYYWLDNVYSKPIDLYFWGIKK